MLITINQVGVISGTIWMPLRGVWTADLVIDQPDGAGFDAGTSVSIVADDGFTLAGVVAQDRTGDFLDAVHVRVLGGAGGMATASTARAFVLPGAFARDVVNGILGDGGETLSTTADATFLATNLNAWSVIPGTVSQALDILISIVAPTFNWRILADGKVWIGAETWPTASVEFTVLDENPTEKTFELGADSPSILPGYTLADVGQVARVEHHIESSSIRSHVWVNLPNVDRGLAGAIMSLVGQANAGIDYLAYYEATVKSQSADKTTLDVLPADTRLAGLSRVALRHGIPGVVVQVAPGAKIMVGFKSGDPSQPFVAGWGGGETLLSFALGSSADNVVTKQDITAINAAIAGAAVVAMDGGAAFKANILAAWPVLVGSQTVTVQR